MSHHDTGWTITPADDTSAIECCAEESRVVVEVSDGCQVIFRSEPVEITALELAINCARHYRPIIVDSGT